MTIGPLSYSVYVLASISSLNFWNGVEDWTGWQPEPQDRVSVVISFLILVALVPILVVLRRRMRESYDTTRHTYASRLVKTERLRGDN